MTEKYRKPLRLAIEDAFLPYLRQVLAQKPVAQHATIQAQFAEHMAFLTDFCLRGYPGPGGLTVEFIKGLHRAMFPPGYRQEIVTRDGHKIWMVPGEFKTVSNNVCDSYLHPGKVNVFLPADQVPAAMRRIVGELNAAFQVDDARRRRDAILHFVLDFLDIIHPFVDGNGRAAFILADLLAIRAGVPPFRFGIAKQHNNISLTLAIESRRTTRSLEPIYKLLVDYGWRDEQNQPTTAQGVGNEWGALTTSMRREIDSIFQSYLRQVLNESPTERHAHIQSQFAEHMDFLTDFCLRGYPRAGGLSVEFIKGLHRACYPPNFREQRIRKDGSCYWLVPGEFKTVDHLDDTFHPAAQVPDAMEQVVSRLNAALISMDEAQHTAEAILHFAIFEFFLIHPFADGNGRVAYILAELLALRAGLAPFGFAAIKRRSENSLDDAVIRAREMRDLAPLYDILEAHGWRRPLHSGEGTQHREPTKSELGIMGPGSHGTTLSRCRRNQKRQGHLFL